MNAFAKTTLAAAVGGLMMTTGAAEAATTAYSMYDLYMGSGLRLADLPVNDASAFYSSNSSDTNYQAPNTWRDAAGTVIPAPNYGWSQGGGLPATWWVEMGAGESANVTPQDFVDARRHGGFIGGLGGDINDYEFLEPTTLSVGSAAYYDSNVDNNWGHNADFGLFTLDHDADVTITISGVTNPAELIGTGTLNLRPGFAVWQGWDSSGATRNSNWDENGYVNANPGGPNPFSPAGASSSMGGGPRGPSSLGPFLGTAWTYTNGGTATLTLSNLTAGNYTIVIGGVTDTAAGATGQNGQSRQYSVGISTTTVPLPAAVWLFGSALTGIGVIGRRRRG